MMFAQTLPDFGLSEGILFAIRIAASVVGAFVGWFVCDPLTRLGYRIIVRAKTPGWLLPWTKLTGAVALALVIFIFLPLGSGDGSGWGFGGGGGGKGKGGKGKGDGTAQKSTVTSENLGTTERKNPQTTEAARESVDIVILGGDQVKDERYYQLKDKGKTRDLNLAELDNYFKQNRGKIQVRIIHTDETAVDNTEESPTRQLQKRAAKYDIYTQGPK